MNFLDTLGQNLDIFVLLAIYIAMYDMQITSYDAIFKILNSFYGRIHNLRDYSIYKVTINLFFTLNTKIDKIL